MLKTGLSHFAFAKGTYVAGSAPTYSGGMMVEGAIRATINLNRAGMSIDADNGLYAADNAVTGGTISIEAAGATKAAKALMCGYTAEESGYKVTSANAPYGGFGFVIPEIDGSGNVKHTVYLCYKTQFSEASIEAQTKASSGGSFGTDTLEGNVMGHEMAGGTTEFIDVNEYATESAAVTALKSALSIS